MPRCSFRRIGRRRLTGQCIDRFDAVVRRCIDASFLCLSSQAQLIAPQDVELALARPEQLLVLDACASCASGRHLVCNLPACQDGHLERRETLPRY